MKSPDTILGCGVLAKEVAFLCDKNGWNLERRFLPPLLHNRPALLEKELKQGLESCKGDDRHPLVFYGVCHPRMDSILAEAKVKRLQGQNCIAMLLGHALFMEKLTDGAYFLLENWALNWDEAIISVFGTNQSAIREIFQSSHKYMLALRTPCSSDFSDAALRASAYVDLPLHWMDVGLAHLESVLREALEQT